MKQIPVLLFGAGGVGRALLQQIVSSRQHVAERAGCRFQVVTIADSHSWVWEPAGLSDKQLQEAVSLKKKREPLSPNKRPSDREILEQTRAGGLEQALVIDVTAAGSMASVLRQALEDGYSIALANKKPLAAPWEQARIFYNNPRVRYESTVGGGQPVIATLRYLLDTNDPIIRIEGQLSGTLGYICRRLDEGARFSVALAAAKAYGYTEPDPREDLGGRDVRRKIMILGRTAGWPLEEKDIVVESLFPTALAHLSVEEFMAASLALDPSLADRVNAAGAAGEVLRYVAEVQKGRGSVGLTPVMMGSPLANLKYISFRTKLYDEEPLLLGGKGAGVEMTAAGVLGDMVGLVRENKTAG